MLISEVAQLKVACGKQHIAFVTSEKELYTWGKTSYGRLQFLSSFYISLIISFPAAIKYYCFYVSILQAVG